MRRLVATAVQAKSTTKRYWGLPPELNKSKDERVLMPTAQVVVIEVGDCDYLLIRYTLDGVFAGDTWHETLDRAKTQADYEYVLGSQWRDLLEGVDSGSWARSADSG